jgi:hypothetical protein
MAINSQKAFLQELCAINTKPENKVVFTLKLMESSSLIKEVLQIAHQESNKVSGKASRALELVCIQKPELIYFYQKDIFKFLI